MPNDTLIPITCPRCKHQWQEDVEKLKNQQKTLHKTIYRGASTDYRVTCPKCGTVAIVTVRQEANDG